MSEFASTFPRSGDRFAAPAAPPLNARIGAQDWAHTPAPKPSKPRHPLSMIAGGALLLLSSLAAVSLVTWTSGDPSLTHLSNAKPANALGTLGAIFSDLTLSALGLAAILTLLPPLFWGVLLAMGGPVDRFKLRAITAPVAVLLLAAFFSSLPRGGTWPLASGYGGLLGDMLYALFAGTAAGLGIERAGLLAALVTLSSGLALMTVALGLSRDDLKAMARFAARPFEPDSSWVAGLKHSANSANTTHPTPSATLAATATPDLAPKGFTPPPLSLSPEQEPDWTTHHGYHGRSYATGPASVSPHAPSTTHVAAAEPTPRTDAAATPTTAPDDVPARAEPILSRADTPTWSTPSAVTTPTSTPTVVHAIGNDQPAAPPAPAPLTYRLPAAALLSATSPQRASALQMSLAEKLRADRLREVLAAFAVHGTVTSHLTGPVVTTFVFEPQSGTRTARILGLGDDIARALDVPAVRLQLAAGRGALVIEVPHDDAIAIGARDLVVHEAFGDTAKRLPLALGATAQGEPVIVDLADLPALLLAAEDAEDRASVLRALVASLVYRHTPKTLALAVADPAGDLGALATLAHCSGHAPCTTTTDTLALLAWAASEIDTRTLRLRSAAQARTIDSYNARLPETDLATDPLPYLVVVLTNLAPLALADEPAFEQALHRLVREGVAVGIHVVMATSRADDAVLPETIRAAFATRIALKLATRIESRAILAETGAEDLLSGRDALATTSNDAVRRIFGGGAVARLHLTSVSRDEADAIATACQPVAQQPAPPAALAHALPLASSPQAMSPQTALSPTWRPAPAPIDDALYGRAISLVRRVSAIDSGMFRRGLGVSYAEALALIDRLVLDRVIGPEAADGAHPVLIGRAA